MLFISKAAYKIEYVPRGDIHVYHLAVLNMIVYS